VACSTIARAVELPLIAASSSATSLQFGLYA
jgi:hypothetical protein